MKNTTLPFQYLNSQCTLFIRASDKNRRKRVLTAIYGTLIPLVIIANLFCIIGIIRTRPKKLNSSQILFLNLFVSDLTVGALQLPTQISSCWKTNNSPCSEIQFIQFLYTFPVLMSASLLCVISINPYINVVSNTYY